MIRFNLEISPLSLRCLSAVSQQSLSCLSAVSQLSLSCLSAVSQLSLSNLSALFSNLPALSKNSLRAGLVQIIRAQNTSSILNIVWELETVFLTAEELTLTGECSGSWSGKWRARWWRSGAPWWWPGSGKCWRRWTRDTRHRWQRTTSWSWLDSRI